MKTSVTIINIPYTSLLISTVYSDSPCQNTIESKYNKIRNIIQLYTNYTMLGCLKPNLGKMWTNPNVGLKMAFQILTQLRLPLSTTIFFIAFLTQHLGFSIFYPNLGSNNIV